MPYKLYHGDTITPSSYDGRMHSSYLIAWCFALLINQQQVLYYVCCKKLDAFAHLLQYIMLNDLINIQSRPISMKWRNPKAISFHPLWCKAGAQEAATNTSRKFALVWWDSWCLCNYNNQILTSLLFSACTYGEVESWSKTHKQSCMVELHQVKRECALEDARVCVLIRTRVYLISKWMHVKLCLPEMTRAQGRRIDRDMLVARYYALSEYRSEHF